MTVREGTIAALVVEPFGSDFTRIDSGFLHFESLSPLHDARPVDVFPSCRHRAGIREEATGTDVALHGFAVCAGAGICHDGFAHPPRLGPLAETDD